MITYKDFKPEIVGLLKLRDSVNMRFLKSADDGDFKEAANLALIGGRLDKFIRDAARKRA